MKKIVNIFSNDYSTSKIVRQKLKEELEKHDIMISDVFNKNASYNIVIGGDGTFINACHDSDFSSIPFIGINTGHLGFYQEIASDRIDTVVEAVTSNYNNIQDLQLVRCTVHASNQEFSFFAINEVVLKAKYASIIHFDMYVNNILLQTFAGDGVIFSTPSGSTAYNLSAGGAILYQSLKGFQITPIAPVKSSLHKSLDKSLVVPSDTQVKIETTRRDESFSAISVDGVLQKIDGIDYIYITMANKTIKKVVMNENWYWKNIKEKFI